MNNIENWLLKDNLASVFSELSRIEDTEFDGIFSTALKFLEKATYQSRPAICMKLKEVCEIRLRQLHDKQINNPERVDQIYCKAIQSQYGKNSFISPLEALILDNFSPQAVFQIPLNPSVEMLDSIKKKWAVGRKEGDYFIARTKQSLNKEEWLFFGFKSSKLKLSTITLSLEEDRLTLLSNNQNETIIGGIWNLKQYLEIFSFVDFSLNNPIPPPSLIQSFPPESLMPKELLKSCWQHLHMAWQCSLIRKRGDYYLFQSDHSTWNLNVWMSTEKKLNLTINMLAGGGYQIVIPEKNITHDLIFDFQEVIDLLKTNDILLERAIFPSLFDILSCNPKADFNINDLDSINSLKLSSQDYYLLWQRNETFLISFFPTGRFFYITKNERDYNLVPALDFSPSICLGCFNEINERIEKSPFSLIPITPTHSFPKEAIFPTDNLPPLKVISLINAWGSNPDRLEGDYFLSKTNENWNLTIFKDKKPFTLQILQQYSGYYKMTIDNKSKVLTGTLKNLKKAAKEFGFSMELPELPTSNTLLMKDIYIADFSSNFNLSKKFVQKWSEWSQRKKGDYAIFKKNNDEITLICYLGKNSILKRDIKYSDNQYFIINSNKNKKFDGTFIDLKAKLEAEGYSINTFTLWTNDKPNVIKSEKIEIATKPVNPPLFSDTELNEEKKEIVKEDKVIPQEELAFSLSSGMSIGNRSNLANDFIQSLNGYDEGGKNLFYKDVRYNLIISRVTQFYNENLISAGSSTEREMILLEAGNTPLLNQHYNTFLKQLNRLQKDNQILSSEVIIDHLIHYMNIYIFPTWNKDSVEFEKIIKEFEIIHSDNKIYHKTYKKSVAVIPIEYFIENKMGVCRHHGIVAGYILDRLVREQKGILIVEGTVQIIRDNITKGNLRIGAHVWVAFTESTGKKWHIDTLWRLAVQLDTPENKEYLSAAYGAEAIENELKKIKYIQKKSN